MFIVSSTHDIHFTKSTMNYNEETQTLQVVINVFTDDLEWAIERTHEALDLEIGAENQHELTDSLVGDYVLDHLIYKNEHRNVNFKFIGFEYDYDICYLYLESDNFIFEFQNETFLSVPIFFEVFDDQENVVDVHLPKRDESLIFTHQKLYWIF
jgi:hypothetical protein